MSVKGEIYAGTVGDRRVVLRENFDAKQNKHAIEDGKPTIEIQNLNNRQKDRIIYMGDDWVKHP